MPDDRPPLKLYGHPGGAGLALRRGTVPGRIERVDVLDGAAVVSTTAFTPPVDGAAADADLALTPWRRRPGAPTVVVHYRRHQPESRVPAPSARSSFRLDPEQIGDRPMTQATPDGSPAQTQGPDLIGAFLDFGTSRAVCGVFDRRRVSGSDAALPAAGVERARSLLPVQLFATDDSPDPAQEIEERTIGIPRARGEAWREIFGCAPLDVHHVSHTRPRSSDLVVTGDSVDFASDATGERVRGAKRHLADLEHEVPGTELSGRDLFRRVYARFAELVADELELPRAIGSLSVTFPTKLPPDKRDELLDVLRTLATKVEMNIDEAVAAAGFAMMKRLGADFLLGVEAFTLHARCPEGGRAWEQPDEWAKARAWHENLLVIDVGGGTTDCALIKVTVVDATPAAAGDSPGRFYKLQPQVLASGGRLNLGGDRLTAQLFTLLRGKFGIRPGDTRFQGVEKAAPRRELFHALWEAAEAVKRQGLGMVTPATVRVCATAPGSAAPDSGAVPFAQPVSPDGAAPAEPSAAEVTVTADELAEQLRDLVAEITWLAGGIARGGLDVSGGGHESVDRVLFSGGSMEAAALRRGIEDGLRRRFESDQLAPTFEVEFDARFAKTGTAVGGVYLDAVADLSPDADDPEVIPELLRGISYLDVDASRLYVNLAADFHVRQGSQRAYEDPVFSRGQRFELEPGGRAYAEGRFTYPVRAVLAVHRYDVAQEGDEALGAESLWATYTMLQSEADQLAAAGVNVRFEIDQEERITLLLCKGTPGWRLEDAPVDTTDVPHGLVAPPEHEGAPATLRYSLYQEVYQVGVGLREREPLAFAGDQVPAGGLLLHVAARRITLYWGLPSAGMGQGAGAGAEPGAGAPTGDRMERDAGPDPARREFGTLADVPEGYVWVSLDATGALRFHQQRPLRRTVTAPLDLLEAAPGEVFEEVMKSGLFYDESKDPFNGTL
ncbi:hypothetical protein [Streptomyces flavofungini]|uniref:Molecular chaperone n=1 Tax=Streptomyces flavofungini TaxID=68200 RepID=A0ABS0XF76_9ACTN|nr:hypothetical protein [Streptomyces flavofungini]MBJ3811885.1 hypothetical protein [Streptomyces flavofungini]GHC52702.1 hypothetical protein GCM10010349_18480 [Streptomyces flavofungini]